MGRQRSSIPIRVVRADSTGRRNIFVERLWRSVKYEEVVCYECNRCRSERKRCFTKDGGRPFGAGLQEQASNRHKLRGLLREGESTDAGHRGGVARSKAARDWLDPKTAATLSDCSSASLYYGIGIQADPVRARQCALLETQGPDGNDGPFMGIGVLMMIYANGRGAARDLDLATSLACRIDGAPFEVHSRVKHLQKLKADHWNGDNFNYCADITSGIAGGLCAVRDAADHLQQTDGANPEVIDAVLARARKE